MSSSGQLKINYPRNAINQIYVAATYVLRNGSGEMQQNGKFESVSERSLKRKLCNVSETLNELNISEIKLKKQKSGSNKENKNINRPSVDSVPLNNLSLNAVSTAPKRKRTFSKDNRSLKRSQISSSLQSNPSTEVNLAHRYDDEISIRKFLASKGERDVRLNKNAFSQILNDYNKVRPDKDNKEDAYQLYINRLEEQKEKERIKIRNSETREERAKRIAQSYQNRFR